jgi:peptidoglycan-associated lipoprotein
MSKAYHSHKTLALLLALGLLAFATGCNNKKPIARSTPPTPGGNSNSGGGDKPVIASFTVEPASIEVGQAVTMRWSVSNATDTSIDQGVGAVQSQGSRQLSPRRSTTYTLTAFGPGGTDTRTVNVTVSNPPPPLSGTAKDGSSPTLSGSEILQQQAQDAYFDYDHNDLRPDAREALTHDAELLRRIFAQDPNFVVILEGHCDERGSGEYNLALGDRRSNSAHDFLVQLGIPAGRLKTISYGKERPQCTDATEECWQKNRRAHLAAGQ